MRNHRAKRWAAGVMLAGAVGMAGCGEEKPLPPALPLAKPVVAEAPMPDQSDPAAAEFVVKALDAHTVGHRDRLEKLKTQHRVMKGIKFTQQGNYQSTRETWAVWPDKFAINYEHGQGLKAVGAVILARSGRIGGAGDVRDLENDQWQEFHADAYVQDWVTTLVALARPETRFVEYRTVVSADRSESSVRAFTPGLPPLLLTFDPKTNFLTRVDYDGREAQIQQRKSLILGNPKDFDGVLLPSTMNVLLNGGSVEQWVVEKVDTPATIDPKRFELNP